MNFQTINAITILISVDFTLTRILNIRISNSTVSGGGRRPLLMPPVSPPCSELHCTIADISYSYIGATGIMHVLCVEQVVRCVSVEITDYE